MLRIQQLKLSIEHKKEDLIKKAAKLLSVKPEDITELRPVKRSLDARKKDDIHFSYVCEAELRTKELEEKDASLAALEEENAGMKTQIAQLEAGELPQAEEAPAADAAKEEAFSIVGEWTVVIDDNQLAKLNVSKEDYEMLKGFGFEVVMTFTEDGKAQLGGYLFGEPMENTVEAMTYEVMGDQIRFNISVHNLEIKDDDTIRIYSPSFDMTMNRR